MVLGTSALSPAISQSAEKPATPPAKTPPVAPRDGLIDPHDLPGGDGAAGAALGTALYNHTIGKQNPIPNTPDGEALLRKLMRDWGADLARQRIRTSQIEAENATARDTAMAARMWVGYDKYCRSTNIADDGRQATWQLTFCRDWEQEIHGIESRLGTANGSTRGSRETDRLFVEAGAAEVDKLVRDAGESASKQVLVRINSETSLSEAATAARVRSEAAVQQAYRTSTNAALSSLRNVTASASATMSQKANSAAGVMNGSSQNCSLSSQQIAAYERGIAESRPYAAVSSEHAQAVALYQKGIKDQQSWHSANCR